MSKNDASLPASPVCDAGAGWLPDWPLQAHNSFGFNVRARWGVRVDDEAALRAALRAAQTDARIARVPRLILGGGSNVVFVDTAPAAAAPAAAAPAASAGDSVVDVAVVQIALRGRRVVSRDADHTIVEAAAGESWHGFVEWTLSQGLAGLENLALIPGTVGAAPVQNIGAYGLELAARFHCLQALDTDTGEIVAFDTKACRFAYRDSIFKQTPGRFVILSVQFALPVQWTPVAAYADVAQALAAKGITTPDARDIFEAVTQVRRHKLPDPAVTGNAGSFFKNPVVDAAQFARIQRQFPDIVAYALADGSVKLAAGWMIDQCGWRGREFGAAAVHARQALVLINPGQARGKDVLALAGAIADDVAQRFGVHLEAEPLIVGAPAQAGLARKAGAAG